MNYFTKFSMFRSMFSIANSCQKGLLCRDFQKRQIKASASTSKATVLLIDVTQNQRKAKF